MMGVRVKMVELLLALVVGLWLMTLVLKAELQVGFYLETCPLAELTVTEEVTDAVGSDSGLAAGLIRLHFHDCFIRGCDGSVLIDSTTNPPNQAEKDSPANNPSLRGLEVIDKIKARLESTCPQVVSCADILAFAARDSVVLSGGLGYLVPAGRRDGRISIASDTFTELPRPSFDVPQLTQSFARKGLSREEMVTLSGAHTLGRSHCTSFRNRLYNFSSTVVQDPSLDPSYAAQLKQHCPKGSTDPSLVVPMNPSSPDALDTDYYEDILANRGLLISDQTLMNHPQTANLVVTNAENQLLWSAKFAAAMVKMGQIGVLTGDGEGEIRLNCRVINRR